MEGRQERGEHPDSPMRKRPRINGGGEEECRTPESQMLLANSDDTIPDINGNGTPANATGDLPSPLTPSKVTLNLRTPDTSPILHQMHHETTSDTIDANGGSAGARTSTLTPEYVVIDDNSQSDSGEAVDIEIDDSEDLSNNWTNGASAPDQGTLMDLCASLLDSFPPTHYDGRRYNHLEKASYWANEAGRDVVHLDQLMSVSVWIHAEWLANLPSTLPVTYMFHVQERAFWDQLYQMYRKLLNNRNLTEIRVQHESPDSHTLLCKFFLPYMQLCAAMAEADLDNLAHLSDSEKLAPEMVSSRHLSLLPTIMREWQTTYLWSFVGKEYHMNAGIPQNILVIKLLTTMRQFVTHLAKLSSILLTDPVLTTKLSTELQNCFSILNLASYHLNTRANAALNNGEENPLSEIKDLIDEISESTNYAIKTIKTCTAKQLPQLAHDRFLHIVEQLCATAHEITSVDISKADMYLGDLGPRSDVLFDFTPLLVLDCVFFDLTWALIMRGKMELRASSVFQFSKRLLGFHTKTTQIQPLAICEAARQYVGHWMAEAKLVEYLTSVESHPQLILRSESILGFLMVTNCWTHNMSKSIWSCLLQNPDPRICGALWDCFGRTLRYFDRKLLSETCRYLATALKPEHYRAETLVFLQTFVHQLTRQMVGGEYALDGSLENPLLPFRRLICDTAYGPQQGQDERLVHMVHQEASQILTHLTESNHCYPLRETIYSACIDDLQKRSYDSLGSVESVLAMLSTKIAVDDIERLVADMGLFETVSEELCLFVEEAKDRGGRTAPHGLEPRLQLCTRLATYRTSSNGSTEQVDRLLSHIIGESSCNAEACESAWPYLTRHLNEQASRIHRTLWEERRFQHTLLVDRAINGLIPQLPPHAFTTRYLEFVASAIDYERLSRPPVQHEDGKIIELPLIDALWRIVLSAPVGTVEHEGVTRLSQYYIEHSYIVNAPRSSVSATHTAVIQRCISLLQESATSLAIFKQSGGSRDEHQSEVTLRGDYSVQDVLRFTRTLWFMTQFVNRAKKVPTLLEHESTASSPATSSSDGTEGDFVEITYQTFGAGIVGKPKQVLRVGSQSTISDLCDRLRDRTGFRGLEIIVGGTKLALDTIMCKSVQTVINKGMLLVRNKEQQTTRTFTKLSGITAADRAVLTRLDDLYAFLDLGQKLSSSVYDFLMLYPPHDQVREMVSKADVDIDALFPPQNRIKALYSIWSLRTIHEHQATSNTVNEAFQVKTIGLLCRALTTGSMAPSPHGPVQDPKLVMDAVECLKTYLLDRTLTENVGEHIENGVTLLESLATLLELGLASQDEHPKLECLTIYRCMLEVALLDESRQLWETFKTLPRMRDLHRMLLVESEPEQRREAFANLIKNTCTQPSSPATITTIELANFYWTTLSPLIPEVSSQPLRSQELFGLLGNLLSNYSTSLMHEAALRDALSSWTTLLSQYQHVELPGEMRSDSFFHGLICVISLSITALKSFKKTIGGHSLLELLINKYLFPPIGEELESQPLRSRPLPVLDVESRKQACSLVTSLSDNIQSYLWLAERLNGLMELEATTPSRHGFVDRAHWIRSSVGFSGLTNLMNTCYMNSLLAQLFMNTDFRAFMLSVQPGEERTGNLLTETQKLFAQMQNSQDKAAQTRAFAYAIKPYDTEHIDVSIQMDVDEFYNLLFDRWESALPSADAKQQFRSFYGGQLVGQVKSKDCEHVSARVEPFFTIQCEVRGKKGLVESLKAYVEGDVMEGDNKYKCESCDGRFVNAVKRSCLKDVPDNLIFHLKRFDFDLTTLVRSKINDDFFFPEHIDMTPYTVDYVNDPSPDARPDFFQLVGVLVHTGTAETGHYYSFIHVPAHGSAKRDSWAEFNDMEVTEFDQSKIPDACFGGEIESGGQLYPKQNNAYMLFYKRVSAVEREAIESRKRSQPGPAQHPLPSEIADNIAMANDQLIRRYCLHDHSYAGLVRRVLSDLKSNAGGNCSDDHEVERIVLDMTINHLTLVFSRVKDVPDFEPIIKGLLKQTQSCGVCCALVLDWIADKRLLTEEMLIESSIALVRDAWGNFIINLLKQHRKLDLEAYNGTNEDTHGDLGPDYDLVPLPKLSSLQKILTTLKEMLPRIGRHFRAWDDYFGVLWGIAELGVDEVAALLYDDIFLDVLQVMKFERRDSDRPRRYPSDPRLPELCREIYHSKRELPPFGLIRLLTEFLHHVSPCLQDHDREQRRLRAYDKRLARFPLMREEWDLMHQQVGNQQLMIVMRMIDLWVDCQSQPYWPSEAVRQLVECTRGYGPDELGEDQGGVDLDYERMVGDTFIGTITEYELDWIQGPLTTALTFCQESSSRSLVEKIMLIAAKQAQTKLQGTPLPKVNAFDNGRLDYEDNGGNAVLQFFMALTAVNNKHIPSLQQEGGTMFLPKVIELAHLWAPGLLVFDKLMTRVSTESALEQLIFNHYPVDHAEYGTRSPEHTLGTVTHLDKMRVRAVRSLYHECTRFVGQAERLRLPQQFIKQICSVMTQCASWCDKLTQQETGAFASLKKRDDDTIVQNYSQSQARYLGWQQDAELDETQTETEWDSDIADSDILTEDAS